MTAHKDSVGLDITATHNLRILKFASKGVLRSHRYMIFKINIGTCDTEKPMQSVYRVRVPLPQSSDQRQLREMEMQTLLSITAGIKQHLPSITLMNNTGCNENSETERLVNTHYCFWFVFFFIFSYALTFFFCSSIQCFSECIDYHTDEYMQYVCSLYLQCSAFFLYPKYTRTLQLRSGRKK